MKNDEILAGLKNALERGSTLDEAAQSFVNAGYSPLDVKEAVSAMNSGGKFPSTSPSPSPAPAQPSKENTPEKPVVAKEPASTLISPEKTPSASGKLVLLIVLLLVLVAGGIASLLFREQITGLFG